MRESIITDKHTDEDNISHICQSCGDIVWSSTFAQHNGCTKEPHPGYPEVLMADFRRKWSGWDLQENVDIQQLQHEATIANISAENRTSLPGSSTDPISNPNPVSHTSQTYAEPYSAPATTLDGGADAS